MVRPSTCPQAPCTWRAAAGASTSVQVGSKAVILVRSRSGYRAFSAVCPHLGCLVKWDSAGKVFRCPCHAAVFDADGKVVSGPPPAPLVEYADGCP